MAAHSTRKTRSAKPGKPYPDFPLTAHNNGQWCKKIRGRIHYFAPWDDPDEALKRYLAQKDYLLAGEEPPREGVLTLRELVNRFLTVKDSRVQSGELSRRNWEDYKRTAGHVLDCLGRDRSVEQLGPQHFEKLRVKLAENRGPVALGNEIQRTRTIFKFAYDTDLIERPAKFGPDFKRPSKSVRRRLRNETGPRMFEAPEIRMMLEAANQPLKAMILLGINCAFGNNDVATLPIDRLDLDDGWHTYGRPKTGVGRRCPLWAETVVALKEAQATRPKPRSDDDGQLVFLTKYGRRFVRMKEGSSSWIDGVAQETRKLLRKLEIHRNNVGFYSLRRTFRTIADEAGDQPATNFIMGHADPDADMASVYRQRIADSRLAAVAAYVHQWLFDATRIPHGPPAATERH